MMFYKIWCLVWLGTGAYGGDHPLFAGSKVGQAPLEPVRSFVTHYKAVPPQELNIDDIKIFLPQGGLTAGHHRRPMQSKSDSWGVAGKNREAVKNEAESRLEPDGKTHLSHSSGSGKPRPQNDFELQADLISKIRAHIFSDRHFVFSLTKKNLHHSRTAIRRLTALLMVTHQIRFPSLKLYLQDCMLCGLEKILPFCTHAVKLTLDGRPRKLSKQIPYAHEGRGIVSNFKPMCLCFDVPYSVLTETSL